MTDQRPTEKTLEERTREELKQHLLAMNLYDLSHDFKSFRAQVRGTREAYDAFKALADGTTDKPFLLCSGGVGSGKTHLCEALVIRMREHNFITRYMTAAELLQRLRESLADYSNVSLGELLTSYGEARVLILDDFEYGNDWEQSMIEHLIDVRYRYRRITVLTTHDISELPLRIASRFNDPDIAVRVLNSGQDFRRRRRRKETQNSLPDEAEVALKPK